MRIFRKLESVTFKLYGRIFSKALLRKVKNRNFTLFCNTCIGGYIYYRMQLRYLSPTINLWFESTDMIKFLLNPTKYLNSELKLLNMENGHPVCSLEDIILHFNHSDSFESAQIDWKRRRDRVDLSNCYAIIVDMDNKIETTDERIKEISLMYKNTVVLNTKHDSGLFKKINLKYQDEWHYNFLGIHDWEKQWDFAKFLNKKL